MEGDHGGFVTGRGVNTLHSKKRGSLLFWRWSRPSCHGIADPVFQLLLLPGIPARDLLEVPGYPADLDHVMAPAFRADGRAAEGTIFNAGDDLVRTVAMVQGAHDLKVLIPTVRAGGLFHDQVAGVTLVLPLGQGDIFEAAHGSGHGKLFFTPMHTIPWIFFHLNL
jgi:hypothetical protein